LLAFISEKLKSFIVIQVQTTIFFSPTWIDDALSPMWAMNQGFDLAIYKPV